jgi:hypothetical protein
VTNPFIADDPRSPLQQEIDDLIEEARRQRTNGFRAALLTMGDGETFNEVVAVIACADGTLGSGPLLFPAHAAADLHLMLGRIMADVVAAHPAAPSTPQ